MESEKATNERESKHILRQIQDHLGEVHMKLGALRESVGMVDVFHHPNSNIGTLNYITPRKNTAWVSSTYLQQGLTDLAQKERLPRVEYIEGLFPPAFARTLRELGLELERETLIMVYKPGGITGRPTPPLVERPLPDGITVQPVSDQESIGHWWYVWRNGHYDVISLGVEPLFVGKDMEAIWTGKQLDYVMYRGGFPVGVARVSLHKETAHISALALLKELRSPAMIQILQTAAIKGALEHGATLVFAPGTEENERRAARKLGFMDFGSIVCYAAPNEIPRGTHVENVEFSILAFGEH
ncbi:MAG: hypothetical protein LCI00_22905 [Chloroflexi bacterium]|nr:hypothetical protein [Chloroflexota bacterium]MCC6895904.1 hypothetical protein [Anaerolineae bacterium]